MKDIYIQCSQGCILEEGGDVEFIGVSELLP